MIGYNKTSELVHRCYFIPQDLTCATGNELTASGEGLAALILEPTFPGRVDGHIGRLKDGAR